VDNFATLSFRPFDVTRATEQDDCQILAVLPAL
jgi:hypothetical protein